MNSLQQEKVTLMLPPQLVDNGNFGTQVPLDLAGAGAAKVEMLVGTLDAAFGSTDEATAPVLEECDTAGGSYTEITGAVLSAAVAATKDDKIYAIDVPNLGQRKRYVRVKAPHAGDGTNGVNLCIRGSVTKLDQGPVTAAERGYEEHIIL